MQALVLSSGGIDSTTCVAMAVKEFGVDKVSTVSFHYGQKHDKELCCAEEIADYYGVKHYVLGLDELFNYSNCSLLKHSTAPIEHTSYEDQVAKSKTGKVSTYVPFRNGMMLSAAAVLAQSLFPEEAVQIWIGAHADDAAGNAYADCSKPFLDSIGKAIEIGTYGLVQLVAPFEQMNKASIVAVGLKLKVPYEFTWSCYEGTERACGVCGTCRDRLKAFHDNGAKDPIEYAK